MKQGPHIHIGPPAWGGDFYIEIDDIEQRVFFRNKWLKDWWRIYHGS